MELNLLYFFIFSAIFIIDRLRQKLTYLHHCHPKDKAEADVDLFILMSKNSNKIPKNIPVAVIILGQGNNLRIPVGRINLPIYSSPPREPSRTAMLNFFLMQNILILAGTRVLDAN